ncbi:MAG: lytic transglycosylase domain-containing protein [Succinivibrio sp.]
MKSPAGAVGLMQLMPGTAKVVSRKSGIRLGALVDPDTNVALGSEYLRQLLSRFNGNRVLASAGYNAGPGRVPRWMSQDGRRRDAAMYVSNIPFDETRGYVQRVLLYTAIYEKLMTGRNAPVLTDSERYSGY